MDPVFKYGERLRIELAAVTVTHVTTDDHGVTWLSAIFEDTTQTFNLTVALTGSVEYTRLTPADGVPQPGELWADQVDTLYAVRAHPNGAKLVDVDERGSLSLTAWQDIHRSSLGPIYRVSARPQHTVSMKSLVSDETIREAEQLERMVAPEDLGLPRAGCGCPIKGAGVSTRVDHCQACIDAQAGGAS